MAVTIDNVSVINEQTFNGEDGIITITASSPDGSITYSLDGVIFQIRNSFNELPPATYTVFVKDGIGNTDNQPNVIVDPYSDPIPYPEYGKKYTFKFNSSPFKEMAGRTWRVDVFLKDFVGLVTEIAQSDESPLVIDREPQNQDKLIPIFAKGVEVRFKSTSTFEYDEFLTSSEEDYRIDVYENNNLYFSGFVLSDLFSLPILKKPVISLVATDGIGTLKGKELKRANDTLFEGEVSFGDYLKELILVMKTNITGVNAALNMEPVGISGAILANAVDGVISFHHDAFKHNLGEAEETLFNWHEWIEKICVSLECVFEIKGGKIWITRVDAKKTLYEYYQMDRDLNFLPFISRFDYDPINTIGCTSEDGVYVMNESLLINSEDLYKKQTIDFDNGSFLTSAFVDGEMEFWDNISSPTYWNKSLGLSVTQVAGVTGFAAELNGVLLSFNDTIDPPVSTFMTSDISKVIVDQSSMFMDFSIDLKIDGTSGPTSNEIYIQLRGNPDAGDDQYYDGSNWSTTLQYIKIIDIPEDNSFHNRGFTNIPLTGFFGASYVDLSVKAVQIKVTAPHTISGLIYDNFIYTLITEDLEDSYVTENFVDSRTIIPDNIIQGLGDARSYVNLNAILLGTHISSGQSYAWSRIGVGESVRLGQLITDTVMNDFFYNSPTWRLTGTIRGELKDGGTLAYNSLELGVTKILMQTGYTFNAKREEWQGEWVQIGEEPFQEGSFLVTTEGDFLVTTEGDFIVIGIGIGIEIEHNLVLGAYVDANTACRSIGASVVAYSDTAIIDSGSKIYTISQNVSSIPADGFVLNREDDTTFEVIGGNVQATPVVCPETLHVLLSGPFVDEATACAATITSTNFYSRDAVLTTLSRIYTVTHDNTSSALTGWYKDVPNDNAIEVVSDGEIDQINACTLPNKFADYVFVEEVGTAARENIIDCFLHGILKHEISENNIDLGVPDFSMSFIALYNINANDLIALSGDEFVLTVTIRQTNAAGDLVGTPLPPQSVSGSSLGLIVTPEIIISYNDITGTKIWVECRIKSQAIP